MNPILSEGQKKQLFRVTVLALGLLSLFLAVKAINAFKEYKYIGKGVYPANVITVNGTGEVYAVPDIASFSFSVTEEAKQVVDAQNKASQKMNTILEALKGLGIEDKDIKTTAYTSYPKYEYTKTVCVEGVPCTYGRQVLIGYEVSQTISVKVRKTDDAGKVLAKVGELGAQNMSGLDFVIDDIEKVRAEARDKAIQDAKAKAKVLAKSLGVDFVRITSFYENNGYPVYGYGGAMEAKAMGGDMTSSVTPQLPAGENKITSNVSISYEVR